ncbi:MAG: aldo/keto reductase [Burkholderiaceae bacterium]
MQKARFGRTDLQVSRLTFGCGAVGGLMVKGSATDQDNAIAWARDNGINFFDTAASYGDGVSETNLGRALNGNSDGLVIGTKVGLTKQDLDDVAGAVSASLDKSLSRLKLDHVDLFQLHNTIKTSDEPRAVSADFVLAEVIPAFEKLRDAGKVRFFGFTANGDTDQLHQLVASDAFDSGQIFYNLLVPSAGGPQPAGHVAQDYRELLSAADKHGVGAIGVRVLAGGALSGKEDRHPMGMQSVAPIGSETDYATDVQHALKFQPLIDAGFASSLPELAIRYVISNPSLPTTEIGIATLDEFQQATQAVNRGSLPSEALELIQTIQAGN